MKPIEPLKINAAQVSVQELAEIVALVHAKLNELIQAHNELLAKYEVHQHTHLSPVAADVLNWEQSLTEPPLDVEQKEE